MTEEDKRKAEDQLASAFESVRFSETLEWLSSREFRAFLDSWKDLREVYIVYDTFTEFHVDVISIYRDMGAYLRKIIADTRTEQGVRKTASEALDELEFWMDELIKEAERNIHAIDDQSENV